MAVLKEPIQCEYLTYGIQLQYYDSAENIYNMLVKIEFGSVQFNNIVYSRCKPPPLSPSLYGSTAADLAKG